LIFKVVSDVEPTKFYDISKLNYMKFDEENINKSPRLRYRVGIRRNLLEFPFLNALRNCEKQILFERVLLVISCKFKGHFTPNDRSGISEDPSISPKDMCVDECRGM